VIGTMGQLPAGQVLLVEDVEQARTVEVSDSFNLAYATQTTLSVDDTIEIVAALRRRFPAIHGPKKEDICYATTNRQAAVKAIAGRCDAMVVIGALNSSNSMRLVEVAANSGCAKSRLLQRAGDMDWEWLGDVRRLGITAGASAPEHLVEELIASCRRRYRVTIEDVHTSKENVVFKLPRELVG
jgi:4-hydroxy-3-methylbut-2-enyl diphosphate reductase